MVIIAQGHKLHIENVMQGMDCPRDFECYRSGLEKLGEVGIVGDFDMIECIEEDAQTCEFGSPCGLGILCKCPLRNFIAKDYHRYCSSNNIPMEQSS